tara:strand:+ start:1968 stop:2165 length:198 start_codon:yes stop_codon:yes gene_type:complete
LAGLFPHPKRRASDSELEESQMELPEAGSIKNNPVPEMISLDPLKKFQSLSCIFDIKLIFASQGR